MARKESDKILEGLFKYRIDEGLFSVIDKIDINGTSVSYETYKDGNSDKKRIVVRGNGRILIAVPDIESESAVKKFWKDAKDFMSKMSKDKMSDKDHMDTQRGLVKLVRKYEHEFA